MKELGDPNKATYENVLHCDSVAFKADHFTDTDSWKPVMYLYQNGGKTAKAAFVIDSLEAIDYLEGACKSIRETFGKTGLLK